MKNDKQKLSLNKQDQLLISELLTAYSILLSYLEKKIIDKELITIPEIINKYHISKSTIYRLYKHGFIQPVYKRRSLYFDSEDVNSFFKIYRNTN